MFRDSKREGRYDKSGNHRNEPEICEDLQTGAHRQWEHCTGEQESFCRVVNQEIFIN